jgi:hypothetical protein
MKPRFPSIFFPPRIAYGIDVNRDQLIRIEATRRHRRCDFRQLPDNGEPIGPNAIVSTCLLQRESFVRWLSAPLASPRKAEKVFPSLLDIQLPFPIETCEFSLVDVQPSTDRRSTMGLVAGARHTDISNRLASLNQLGITPRILDHEGLALWSQLQEEYPAVAEKNTFSAVLFITSDRLTLAVGRGSSFLGAHTMKDADPDLIQRILKSYLPETPSSFLWFWSGPGAANSELTRRLQSMTIPSGAGPAKLVREPETFLARALAARALTSGPCRCNLLSGKFLHPAEHIHQKQRPFKTAILCLMASLTLGATTLTWKIAAQQRSATMQQELRNLAVSITGSPRLVQNKQELIAARRAMSVQDKLYAPFMAPFIPSLPEALKSILGAAALNGLTIESLTMNRQAIIAHGLATKWTQCEKAADSLSGSGWTARIDKKDTTVGETRVAFVLRLTPSNETR